MAASTDIIGIGTEFYGHIKGSLKICASEPDTSENRHYDHVVESGIMLKSGVLQVLDCPYSEVQLEVKLQPGNYRIRMSVVGLTGIASDDLDEQMNDIYKIEIWPAGPKKREVLKQFRL